MIKLRFTTLDGIKKTKSFKTLKGARKAVWDWVGKDADLGGYYAVSADGVVIVTIESGCTLAQLFSDKEPGKPGEQFWLVVQWVTTETDMYSGPVGDKCYATEAQALEAMQKLNAAGYYDLGVEGWCYDAQGFEQAIVPPKLVLKPELAPIDDEIPF